MENIIELTILTPLISIIVFILLIVLMIYVYRNMKFIELVLLIFFISMIVGVMSIQVNILPFSPIIQTFFMMFHLIMLLNALINTNFKRGNDND